MKIFLASLFSSILLIAYRPVAEAQGNAKLDARWEVIHNRNNASDAGSSGMLTVRLQVRCTSPGLHRLNSGDFYVEYDSSYMVFSHRPESGEDYVWADKFNPKTNPLYRFSKVVDFGINPFNNSGNNLMDISIIDTSHTQGTLLDSGVWTDVADLSWHIEKPRFSTELIWQMTKKGNVLTNVYESFEDVPKNFDEGEGWLDPFIVRLE